MRIHHLNCGTCCPWGGRLMDGRISHAGQPATLVCHCLLLETDSHGLVLVDTGFGMRDARRPGERLSPFFRGLNRPRLDPEETALRQVQRLGFSPRDVRHIVLTHLDFDHAGGVEDFPGAMVHLMGREFRAATKGRDGFIASQRYRPEQWDDRIRWRPYDANAGEGWFGFQAVRDLDGLPPEILMVPLYGHTEGHAGVAIRLPDGWLLHAGDAYFHAAEMDADGHHCPPGLRGYQTMMEVDRRSRLHNQRRLRGLVAEHGREVVVFCGHDPDEFQMLKRLRGGTGDRHGAEGALAERREFA
ncbi:MBL fold metallo-hydrolase [Aerophototrophica crusticola]|uniref:MBL fold metallo-hydrolase n=1 Tax=Aerophototrophica crusticola TaxID=1709002 RepID=A0A858RBA6_9PROT|nr:MBL fold metallo-hydrolase [Rhodospirillaceae bacterium B3]